MDNQEKRFYYENYIKYVLGDKDANVQGYTEEELDRFVHMLECISTKSTIESYIRDVAPSVKALNKLTVVEFFKIYQEKIKFVEFFMDNGIKSSDSSVMVDGNYQISTLGRRNEMLLLTFGNTDLRFSVNLNVVKDDDRDDCTLYFIVNKYGTVIARVQLDAEYLK